MDNMIRILTTLFVGYSSELGQHHLHLTLCINTFYPEPNPLKIPLTKFPPQVIETREARNAWRNVIVIVTLHSYFHLVMRTSQTTNLILQVCDLKLIQ